MILAGAACILLFSYILSKMDYIPLVCIMCIKMLGRTLRQAIRLTPASAAPLPAELQIQTPLHRVEKETLPCLGLQMATVIPGTFCIFKTPRQKKKPKQQKAMNKDTD